MIWLSRSNELKKIILTLSPWNLEYIGEFNFFVREKKIIKLYGSEISQFCLFLSAETGDYGATVTVPIEKYHQARLGEPYGLCGVIRNIKYNDFIFITENTNQDKAIRQVVARSWAKMAFIVFVFGLCLGTMLIFIDPLLHISWR